MPRGCVGSKLKAELADFETRPKALIAGNEKLD